MGLCNIPPRGRQNANRMGCSRYRKLARVGQWVKIVKVFLKIENKTKEIL